MRYCSFNISTTNRHVFIMIADFMPHRCNGLDDFRFVTLLNNAEIIRCLDAALMFNFCNGHGVLSLQVHIMTEDDIRPTIKGQLVCAILFKRDKAIAVIFQNLYKFGVFLERKING